MDPETSESYTWTPPIYDTSRPPANSQSISILPDPDFENNFARTVKWCPDGSTLLAQCENRSFQLLNPNQSNTPPLVLNQPAPILDFAWFPSATSSDPASYCFVASVREGPVRLLDASDGRLRASYSIVDHRERHVAPHCVAFNPTAERLYTSFESAIEMFHVSSPGTGSRLRTTPSRGSKDGLKGIISSLAFSHCTTLLAAGTLTPAPYNIALFDTDGHVDAGVDSVAVPVMFLGGGPAAAVTQLAYHPTSPHIILASFRRRKRIYAWDIRGTGEVPLAHLVDIDGLEDEEDTDNGLTNQRTRFDIDIAGRWLAAGDQSGEISMFDLNNLSLDQTEELDMEIADTNGIKTYPPALKFAAHQGKSNSIGAVGFNPLAPLLVSVSGSRCFEDESNDDSLNSSESDSDEERNITEALKRRKNRKQPLVRDASVKLWDFSASSGSVSV